MDTSLYPEAFAALAQTAHRMAECIKITREDGTIYRFTAYSEDLVLTEGDAMQYTYKRANSFDITALELSDGLSVSNMDLNCIIDDDDITEADLLKGLFDQANVYLFIAVWDSSGVVWQLPLRQSWIGEVQSRGLQFKGDLRGITQRLAQVFSQTTSLECRYIFGDSNCTVDLAPYTVNTTVAAVNSAFTEVTSTADLSARTMRDGRLIVNDGQSAGVDIEIIKQSGSTVTLLLPLAAPLEVGDSITLIEGCSKTTASCNVYSNILNYGGEPYLEGKDVFGRYPDAAKE
jgi:uncharacterized phage protein (TIGR02218 family)